MFQTLKPYSSNSCTVETLETRTLLSTAGSSLSAAAPVEHAAIHADTKAPKPTTKTLVSIASGTLGQAIKFNVTIQTAAQFGAPGGTVTFYDHGTSIGETSLAPLTSPDPKYVESRGSFTIPAGAGSAAYYFGRHPITAKFMSDGSLLSSTGHATIVIKQPTYTVESNGLKIATVETGFGPGIQSTQTANMLYTDYLAGSGHVFDDSEIDGGSLLSFALANNPETVLPAFAQGTLGMESGETRVLSVPAKLAYNAHNTPPMGKSLIGKSLVFLITLEGIS